MYKWKRVVELDIDGLKVRDVKIAFNIKRDSTAASVSGDVTMFNLAANTEQQIHDRAQSIVVTAGYDDVVGVIFDGAIQRIDRERDISSQTRTTKVAIGTKTQSKEKLSGVSTVSFAGEMPLVKVIQKLVGDLELMIGPTNAIPADTLTDFEYSGDTAGALTELLVPRKVEWYEDDGVIRFNSTAVKKQNDSVNLIEINAATGMIGAPSIIEDGGSKARTLLNPFAKIGDIAKIESVNITEQFKIVSLKHSGDNWDGKFFTEFILAPLDNEQSES